MPAAVSFRLEIRRSAEARVAIVVGATELGVEVTPAITVSAELSPEVEEEEEVIGTPWAPL